MSINRFFKIAFFLAVFLLASSATALACTGFYVGRDVSQDGSTIIARTEDMTSYNSKRFIIHQAMDHPEGTMFKDSFGLTFPMPAHTLRYSALPGSKHRGIGEAPFGAAGYNELGVGATSTVTGYPNEAAITADPFVKTGLHELSANDIILQEATSARHGVEIVARIVDNYGSGEGNIIMIADQNEAWYMEIYTGHQYAAIKLPTDMAAVIPNAFMLGEIDVDSEDVIVSPTLVSLAEENGFLKTAKNGKINIRNTYAEAKKNSNTLRIWEGQRLLYGDVPQDAYKTEYNLLFKPSKKISANDIMNATRSRFEQTKYHLDIPGNKYLRSISTSRQEECHILAIRHTMPVTTACVMWLTLSNAEFAPYVPYYPVAMTQTPEVCRVDTEGYNELSMYWAGRALNTLSAQNRTLYGNAVKSFWKEYERALIEYLPTMDSMMNASLSSMDTTAVANRLAKERAYDSYGKTREIYKQLIEFIAAYEGEDETPNNTLEFTIKKITPTVEEIPAFAVSPAATITN